MKTPKIRILCILVLLICFIPQIKSREVAGFVNPFIGTGKSIAKTKWGNYGGTYPGAVCPWGVVQVSPETSIRPGERGYYYEDSLIRAFSCTGHRSGFPNGSAGKIHLLFEPQAFKHTNEEASAGYYSVIYDNGDRVETTATTRTGMFRYTPVSKTYTIGLTNAGDVTVHNNNELHTSQSNGIIRFSIPWKSLTQKGDTLYLQFAQKRVKQPLLIKIGISATNREASKRNLNREDPDWDFEAIRKQAEALWNKELRVVELPYASTEEKVLFYTALYHSLLLPWVASDTGEENRYSNFSFWDTFRSLHPLLTLLKPQVQADMVHSLEKQYKESGHLPNGPMTGFHVIPTLLDAYIKGIRSFNTEDLFTAMRNCLTGEEPRRNPTIDIYRQMGYLPDSEEHSVNTTLEFAYNDWALSEFASRIGKETDAKFFNEQSFNYRNLFDVKTRFMLPRHDTSFNRSPGEMGYQESNKWTSTFFVPHNIQDLINLMGGDEKFVSHLEQCYKDGPVIHDNEPVFHYPYLFSYAGRPDLTAEKIQEILHYNYMNAPGGIPGNDDLGSMSSWYVLSSMGIYPVCPGTNEYVLTTPAFKEVILHLPGGKRFTISKEGEEGGAYFSALTLNGESYKKLFITHDDLTKGGSLTYTLSAQKEETFMYERPYSLTKEVPDTKISDISIALNRVTPGEENTLFFTLTNKGATDTHEVTISNGNKVIANKRIYVEKGEAIHDSLSFKLYAEGPNRIQVADTPINIEVLETPQANPTIVCHDLRSESLVKPEDCLHITTTLQNISGKRLTESVPIYLDKEVIHQITCTLDPGELVTTAIDIPVNRTGIAELRVLGATHKIKFYKNSMESAVLVLDFDIRNDSIIQDVSGFTNHGRLHGPVTWCQQAQGYSLQTGQGAYIELPSSESLMRLGNTLTLAAWIYPMKRARGYVDFFTKGDYTLLKMEGPETLVFFCGGWGRGVCQAKVPDNWYNEWHHVAGVCTGDQIRLYIDGELKQETPVTGEVEYTEVPWNIGRNAEMPYSRFFEGRFDNVHIFKEPLTSEEIEELYQNRSLK